MKYTRVKEHEWERMRTSNGCSVQKIQSKSKIDTFQAFDPRQKSEGVDIFQVMPRLSRDLNEIKELFRNNDRTASMGNHKKVNTDEEPFTRLDASWTIVQLCPCSRRQRNSASEE